MTKLIDIAGFKFGRWTVIRYLYNKHNHSYWECRCECGKTGEISSAYMRTGKSKSCGCFLGDLREEKKRKTMTERPYRMELKNVLRGMQMRCNEVGFHLYKNYGGRGIKICEEWTKSPHAFVLWAHAAGFRPGLQIDRIDNDKGYSPENCRFVTRIQNMNNTRRTVRVEFLGKLCTYRDIADKLGISYERARSTARRPNGVKILESKVLNGNKFI